MRKCLLFFDECESKLSNILFNRDDIDFVLLRTTKNLKYLTEEYLEKTKKYNSFIVNYTKPLEKEVERFKSYLKDNGINLTHFYNDSEYYQEFANRFARSIGLPALTEQQVNWVRDKVDMKDNFRSVGLRTVDYRPVENFDDVKQFFISQKGKSIIFKPRKGMNSIETYKIDSIEQINELPIDMKKGKYMVEEFCYDREWSIESLVQDGRVLDSYVTYIPNPTIWAAIDNKLNCHMTTPRVPQHFKFIPKELIQQIVDGMSLKNGVMTIEIFVDQFGNVMPSELGWRLPGCQATLNHSLSYGFDMYNALIDIMIGNKVKLDYRYPIRCVGDLYLPNKEGLVTQMTSLEELLVMEGVIDGEMFAQIGKNQIKRRVGNDSSGWVQVVGRTTEETEAKMQNVFDNFNLEIEKGVMKKYEKK